MWLNFGDLWICGVYILGKLNFTSYGDAYCYWTFGVIFIMPVAAFDQIASALLSFDITNTELYAVKVFPCSMVC